MEERKAPRVTAPVQILGSILLNHLFSALVARLQLQPRVSLKARCKSRVPWGTDCRGQKRR